MRLWQPCEGGGFGEEIRIGISVGKVHAVA